jgi:hypothetical protein
MFHLANELLFISNRHCLEEWQPEARGLDLGENLCTRVANIPRPAGRVSGSRERGAILPV